MQQYMIRRRMNRKELKRLSRGDLPEMMPGLSRENGRLEKELQQAKHQPESRMLNVEKSGSPAEAALSLNGVFQAAQAEKIPEQAGKRQTGSGQKQTGSGKSGSGNMPGSQT